MRKSRLHIGREFNRDLGLVFNEVPEVYDRVRPAYPDELFEDLVAITGLNHRSSILEVGCGTGQATRSLAALGCSIAAVEPGEALAALARHKLEAFPNVEIETTTFEQWHDRGRATSGRTIRVRASATTREYADRFAPGATMTTLVAVPSRW